MELTLRPVRKDDLDMFRRFHTEPGLVGNDWWGFRDAEQPARRFAEDGYLGKDNGRRVVDVRETAGATPGTAGLLSWAYGLYSGFGSYIEIGIALLPDFRGRGIGWRAQAVLTDYLFTHRPVQRIQAATQPENIAEQKALVEAGFQFEGQVRAAEFRAGQWRDGMLYSRLRDDPAPKI